MKQAEEKAAQWEMNHYLGKMDMVCGHCGGEGFQAKIQGYFTNSDRKMLPHFGSLCCCQGSVTQSKQKYNLPA